MAVKHELHIEIAPDGTLKIKTHGFKGRECEDELKPIEKALGKVKRETKTGEYYEKAVSKSGKITTSTK
jgi:hypothetical protein